MQPLHDLGKLWNDCIILCYNKNVMVKTGSNRKMWDAVPPGGGHGCMRCIEFCPEASGIEIIWAEVI